MTRRLLTHFSTAFLVHVGLLFSGMVILGNENVQKDISERVLNLRVASQAIFTAAAPSLPAPAKKIAPTRPSVASSKTQAAPETVTQEVSTQAGSIMGAKGGSSDGVVTTDKKLLYKAELRALIDENKFYPAVAKRLQQTGTAVVKFTLLSDGSITNVKLDESSGNDRLDEAALAAVQKVRKFRAIPSEFETSSLELAIPIKFSTL